MELRARETKTRKRHSTEAEFENKVAARFKARGYLSKHNREEFEAGVPDHYVQGGRWIEFKVIGISGKRKVRPQRHMSPRQVEWLDDLASHGESTFVCVQWQFNEGLPLAMIMDWRCFRDYGPMGLDDIMMHSNAGETGINFIVDYVMGLDDGLTY